MGRLIGIGWQGGGNNNYILLQYVVVKRRAFSFGQLNFGGHTSVLAYIDTYSNKDFGENKKVLFQFPLVGQQWV